MDTRQLKAFVAVFEERNITKAAARLCLTQPTLSVTIRQLEEELGAALFVREARGVVVSEAARRLYPQAQQLLTRMAQLKAQFQAPQGCLPLALGVEADLGSVQLAALLGHCRQALPQLLLEVLPGCCGDLRLASEELRCEDELFFPLWDENFVLARIGRDAVQPGEIEPLAAAVTRWPAPTGPAACNWPVTWSSPASASPCCRPACCYQHCRAKPWLAQHPPAGLGFAMPPTPSTSRPSRSCLTACGSSPSLGWADPAEGADRATVTFSGGASGFRGDSQQQRANQIFS